MFYYTSTITLCRLAILACLSVGFCHSFATSELDESHPPYIVELVNDTPHPFELMLTELSGTRFENTPSVLSSKSTSQVYVHTDAEPAGIIRFHHNARPSFSLIFMEGKVYTSYCKDKPSAYQTGMFCQIQKDNGKIRLNIRDNG